jgi:hypothetical protein
MFEKEDDIIQFAFNIINSDYEKKKEDIKSILEFAFNIIVSMKDENIETENQNGIEKSIQDNNSTEELEKVIQFALKIVNDKLKDANNSDEELDLEKELGNIDYNLPENKSKEEVEKIIQFALKIINDKLKDANKSDEEVDRKKELGNIDYNLPENKSKEEVEKIINFAFDIMNNSSEEKEAEKNDEIIQSEEEQTQEEQTQEGQNKEQQTQEKEELQELQLKDSKCLSNSSITINEDMILLGNDNEGNCIFYDQNKNEFIPSKIKI